MDKNKNHPSQDTIQHLLYIMERLRKECPWDGKQTHQSLKRYLIEESYEVLEAIDHDDWSTLAAELGDLLLQVVFHSQIASEQQRFDFNDVTKGIIKKLIERHPHVFGDTKVNTAEEVQKNWEHTKHEKEKRTSLLSGIPAAAPALLQAQRLQDKAATVGFDWETVSPVMDKLQEEVKELQVEIRQGNSHTIEHELGDILFTIVNICRYFKVTAEDALRKTNKKFVKRFQYIEKQYGNNPKAMKEATLEELDAFWEEAKKQQAHESS